MVGKQTPKRCCVQHCDRPAGYAFLAVTGDQVDRVCTQDGHRIRCCQPHLMLVVDKLHRDFARLPGGGPARLRAVPLGPG